MSAKKEGAAILGVGAAACAVCCVGPILGVLATIGLGTAAGFAVFGALAIVVGAAVVLAVILTRQRRRISDVWTSRLTRQPPSGAPRTR